MHKIFIELPTWLGDTVMTTPAIENLLTTYPDAQITIFGSFVSTQAIKNIPNISNVVVDNSRDKNISKIRLLALRNIAKSFKDEFDLAISFRKTFSSKMFMFFLNAKKKIQYKRYTKNEIHQVIRYNDFLVNNDIVSSNLLLGDLKLYFLPKEYQKKTLGINPGATYGSAKRWSEEGFAKVACEFSDEYDIVVFGGPNEVEIADDICARLDKMNVSNYTNLAGKTNIDQLIEHIAGLDLFITNDSGPMHIASAFVVPTIAIFGPTKDSETSMWNNKNGKIVKKNLDCMPCMKRVCPLSHHNCMKLLDADEVIFDTKLLLKNLR
jgi:heptosyltransferase-2